MRAGELKDVVAIQRPPTEETQDSTGQPTGTFVTVVTTRAKIELLRATERFTAQQNFATATHRITVRYEPALDAIDATWIVTNGDHVYKLIGPPDLVNHRNRYIVLIAEEGPPV